jgi:glycosyltransferase involved in cell wall biosynthesis
MSQGPSISPRSRDVVLLSTADWDHPFWTNKQHVAMAMAQLGHRVLYVESVGLRPPRLEGQDLRRIWRRLRRGLRPPRRVAENIWVWSPLLIPAAHGGWKRACNRLLFAVWLEVWRRLLHFKADLLWTYNPLSGLLISLPQHHYQQLVYHCVDDLAAQPCMPAALIEREEERLCRCSDQVFVTSLELLRTRSPFNSRIRYDSNVADIDFFAQARDQSMPIAPDLLALPEGARLGFIGAVSAYKLDFDLLALLAKARPDCQIILIGRLGEGDPTTDLQRVESYPNIHFLGPRAYAELPFYLRGFDLALLPCPINSYTRSMFPMKFFEYMAAGVPIVSTDLPALQDYADLACLCRSRDDFLDAIHRLLSSDVQRNEAVVPLGLIPQHCSYRGRTHLMMQVLDRLRVGV